MNKSLLVLNVILILGMGFLFYIHFSKGKHNSVRGSQAGSDSLMAGKKFVVAYFEMDSVESNFVLAKQMQAELTKKDDNINSELNRLKSSYQQKYQKFQQEGPTMNEAQIEAAQRELYQLEQTINSRKAQLEQDYQSYYMNRQQEILTMIRKFCDEYNKEKKFSMIIANEPGLIYYKDSTYNITSDLLTGLNDMYNKQKKKS